MNEDTHGNTLQMQAEIRKLKEALAQFQSGAALTNQVKMEPGQFSTFALIAKKTPFDQRCTTFIPHDPWQKCVFYFHGLTIGQC